MQLAAAAQLEQLHIYHVADVQSDRFARSSKASVPVFAEIGWGFNGEGVIAKEIGMKGSRKPFLRPTAPSKRVASVQANRVREFPSFLHSHSFPLSSIDRR
jgi:hypothetical protein